MARDRGGGLLPDLGPARRAICRALVGQAGPDVWSGLTASDWDAVGTVARAEGVAPLLCRALEQAGWPERMPDAVRNDLTSARYAAAARSELLCRELVRILETLSQPLSIPVVLLKGAALGFTLYPDLALRPMSDVDVLVPRDRLDEALARLKARGYRERPPKVPGLDRLVSHNADLESGGAFSTHLEVHWTLVTGEQDRHAPDMGWFWDQVERLTPLPFHPSAPPLTLTPTAHLLYLAAHLILQHGGSRSRLIWFYDVHLLIERQGERIDWDELARRARQFHWSPAVVAALEGVRERFGTALPDGVLVGLTRGGDERVARLVCQRTAPIQTRATRLWTRLDSLGWPARLRLMGAVLFPSPAYIRHRYRLHSVWLWPVYYPYRWLDLLWELVRTLRRMIHGKRQIPNSEPRSQKLG